MTQPNQPQPEAQPEQPTNIAVVGQVVPGPQGPLVALIIQCGFSSHQLVLAPDAADQLAPVVAQTLTRVAAEARRINSGIMLPAEAAAAGLALPPMPSHSGNGARRQ